MTIEIRTLRKDKLKLEQEKKDILEKNSANEKIKILVPLIKYARGKENNRTSKESF